MPSFGLRSLAFITLFLVALTGDLPAQTATVSRPAASSPLKIPLETPGTLKVFIDRNHSHVFTAASLKSLPHTAVIVHNPHTNSEESYSGVPLIVLLSKLGVPQGKDLHGKALSEYVVASGSDGYRVVLALAEIDPAFHPGGVIVADAMNGKPLDAKAGPFRLVVTEDKRPARSVRNLVSIEVRQAE